MYCEEKDRSWCSSSYYNDHRAITIEVASDTFYPYAVTDKAYNALIELVADICKRNNIKQLLWKADPSLIGQVDKQNMTVHKWFAPTDCPGDYLYNLYSDIAERVNKIINAETSEALLTTFKVGDEVSIVGDKYNPYCSFPIPNWVKSYTHIITKTKSGGNKVYKGGKECVLLGEKIDKGGNKVAGINTWVAVDSLEHVTRYRTHTVKDGESLWYLAVKYLGDGMRYPEIRELNNLPSDFIFTGQTLKIPV